MRCPRLHAGIDAGLTAELRPYQELGDWWLSNLRSLELGGSSELTSPCAQLPGRHEHGGPLGRPTTDPRAILVAMTLAKRVLVARVAAKIGRHKCPRQDTCGE